jgi:hypothetical protein
MSEPTVKELMEKIAQLEAGIAALQVKLDKEIKNSACMFRLNHALRDSMASRVDDFGERIKNMELTLFPKLQGAINSAEEIVPFDGKAWNELDYRNPWGDGS